MAPQSAPLLRRLRDRLDRIRDRSPLAAHGVRAVDRFVDTQGSLLAAARGECDWPHNVYKVYWPIARADSFAPGAAEVCAEGLKVPLPVVADSAAVDLAL